jgi:hypothetical protein
MGIYNPAEQLLASQRRAPEHRCSVKAMGIYYPAEQLLPSQRRAPEHVGSYYLWAICHTMKSTSLELTRK